MLIAYSLGTMIQLAALGGQPKTAAEAFRLLQANRVLGLLRLDLPTVLAMPLYYLLFLGLFAGLWRTSHSLATLGTASAFALVARRPLLLGRDQPHLGAGLGEWRSM